MTAPTGKILQFSPFTSLVYPDFWHKLMSIKIDVDRLSDKPRDITGVYYNNAAHPVALFMVDSSSLNETSSNSIGCVAVKGKLINKNTIEEFKDANKSELMKDFGKEIWKKIENGQVLEDPRILNNFLIFSFADLKKYKFYYWFAFPAIQSTLCTQIHGPVTLKEKVADQANAIDEILTNYNRLSLSNQTFCIIKKCSTKFIIESLKQNIQMENKECNFTNVELDEVYFCFTDPSGNEFFGWPGRQLIAFLMYTCPNLLGKTINLIGIRITKQHSIGASVCYQAQLPETVKDDFEQEWIGWEPNPQGKFTAKVADMGKTMDTKKMCEEAANLNLKLMKWRLLPNINLNLMSKTKCLLFGSGTLGCAVARSLLAWGVTHITFIDNGSVSYSNPTRQYLFTFHDAENHTPKAKAAPARLKEIYPPVTTEGHKLLIPMPGHTVGESMMEKTLNDLEQIKTLVRAHDVLFLLTDSRESRWLPTLLGAAEDKIVINAALGFDSYLVMRHGTRSSVLPKITEPPVVSGLKRVYGWNLGCYFCNDIVAPGNSMKDRTLDQQCTVTRPGVSNIASSLAVELLIAVLQSEHGINSPAYTFAGNNSTHDLSSIPEDILGIVPHSIRGNISTYEQILPTSEKFTQCIACSQTVIEQYNTDGNQFLLKVFETNKYLEDLVGITELLNLQHSSDNKDCLDDDFSFDEEGDEMSDS